MTQSPFLTHQTDVDLCVIGGGVAGTAAALAAARRGLRVALMQDRPVLGGNASSECRVHICGADIHNTHKNLRETGILEEWRMENLYRNPNRNFSVWDTILYESAKHETNITLLLNCSCVEAEMDGSRIRSVRGWQTTTQTWQEVRAKIFADCSGDGILAPLSGARFRMGREARHEFNESIAPLEADVKTMGMTILFQAREFDTPQRFEPLPWAHTYERCEDLPYGAGGHNWWQMGYWWVELGGEADSIADTEALRDELLRVCYGIWDHIKNHPAHRAESANWALEWVQFLPAKRESRRYIGRHILTQNEIEAGGKFNDVIGYGGWSMDDHHPAGFGALRLGAPATIFHPAPAPYGIPYGCIVSADIDNLMFAGRDASCTHAAMSSMRVMGTCFTMGQALGTAAVIAAREGVDPAAVQDHITELQQMLLEDDCYLPGVAQQFSTLTRSARLSASQGDPEPVRDGWNRTIGEDDHAWTAREGDWIRYDFDAPVKIHEVRLVLDSALQRTVQMSYHQADDQLTAPPPELPKCVRLEGLRDGTWMPLYESDKHHQRLLRVAINKTLEAVRFTIDQTWGGLPSRVFAFSLVETSAR
ncbi:MAG: FAD-dependent oxidoreductase [Anaerolineaceae bacterium]|nr:FAD-dependent oxidoreductase [Anaerolineaceae bacterium]